MAIKYAQRLDTHTLAVVLEADPEELDDILVLMEQLGLVRRWHDGRWGLTSLGNLNRNRLTF